MIELLDSDFIPDEDDINDGPYDAPSTIPYYVPNSMEELPFVRCTTCGKEISDVSSKVADLIRKYEQEYYRLTGQKMDRTNVEKARKKALDEVIPQTLLPRYCCRREVLEHMNVREQPRYNKRYIEDLKHDTDELIGNIAKQKVEKFSYNPYTLRRGDYLPNDEPENEGEVIPALIKDLTPSKAKAHETKFPESLSPDMPERDASFQEEIIDIHKDVPKGMKVAGFAKTGVKGYESPIITGRGILAR